MKKSIITLSVVLSFILMGCPYESKYSIGDLSNSSIDTTIIGRWYSCDTTDNETFEIAIFKFNEKEYYIETVNISNDLNGINIKTERYKGFSTIINNVFLLNIQPIELESIENADKITEVYSFFKYCRARIVLLCFGKFFRFIVLSQPLHYSEVFGFTFLLKR